MEKKMFDFLDKIVPNYGGCALIELENESVDSHDRYMLAIRIKVSNGDMFLLNGRFFYDYDFKFDSEKWKLLFQKFI